MDANFSAFTKEKKKLVFLHGYLSSSDSFFYQTSYFSRDFEVFAPDFKGFGKNTGMDRPYCLDDYVNELKDFLESNGVEKPFVVAHSFGARVALKACYRYPNIFDRLVLTGAAGLKPRSTLKKVFRKTAFNILKRFVPRERLTRFYSSDYLALDEVMKQSFKLIVSEHLDGVLDSVNIPTFIVFGDKDKETPPYMAKRFNKKIKNSKMLMIKGAGHFCFIDSPLKFNLEVREFLLSR